MQAIFKQKRSKPRIALGLSFLWVWVWVCRRGLLLFFIFFGVDGRLWIGGGGGGGGSARCG